MIRFVTRRALLPCATVLALGGCAVGPDFERPATQAPVPEAWAAEAGIGSDTPLADAAPNLRWWEGFGDPVLNGLIDEALIHNNDLDAAAARVLEARAQLGGSTSALLPSLNLGATASRSQSASRSSSSMAPRMRCVA